MHEGAARVYRALLAYDRSYDEEPFTHCKGTVWLVLSKRRERLQSGSMQMKFK